MTRPHQPRTRPERTAADTVRQLRRGLAAEIRTGRQDAGLSLRQLAATAGVSPSTLRAIELDEAEPSLQVLARVGTSLGMSLSVRLFPGTGPLIRDHLQAAMLNALLGILDKRWRARPEVAVRHPVRGVIDLVLDEPPSGVVIACEAQSELRRLEQQLRWSRAKADALATDARPWDEEVAGSPGSHRARADETTHRFVGRLLLVRSTVRTRAIVTRYSELVSAAYPARASDAYACLTASTAWPGDALLWCRVEGGNARVLERPPRGVNVGR
jgi:transcriptional regulator with XRE-family HTH domain